MNLQIISNAITHPGLVRDHNEDNFLIQDSEGIWLVADGMGGHQQGDYASALVASPIPIDQPIDTLTTLIHYVKQVLLARNQMLLDYAKDLADNAICGCTVVALLVKGNEAALLWAGDSRAYHHNALQQLLTQKSQDHTYLASLVASGDLTQEDAVNHPYSSMLTRAMGLTPELEFDFLRFALNGQERFLLCTDGLYNELNDEHIAQYLSDVAGPGATCKRLIESVLQTPARDNATALVVDIL